MQNSRSTAEVMFSVWSAPRLFHSTDQVQFSECSAVDWNKLVREQMN
jgi:hypothetical protein